MRKCKQQKRSLRRIRNREIKLRVRARKMKKLQYSESVKSHMGRMNWLLNKI